ncbi:Zn-ribbon domain-containing OB-fold protein [Streptomyces sulphureus]|uniref:Zn-ribbon domain-containing OB-fold protein n=1 Tax=Streptomyces sulphureus TaxID=47758 RepID=UPI00037F167A|nr:hypothetical protein [Streptomyces sulphureus]
MNDTRARAEADWLVDEQLAPLAEEEPLAPLYRAADAGELALPRCAACRLPFELEQRVCDGCGGIGARWESVEPYGTVHAVTVMHRLESGLVRTAEPYPLLDVETRSGHRLIMTTVRLPESVPRIGDPVAIGFRRVGGVAVPAASLPVRNETKERS